MKIILLNGPPRSGKDHAATILQGLLRNVRHYKVSQELKERTHAFYGITDQHGKPVRHDFFESRKDTELSQFEGMTPRQAYIAMSENYIKPTHGRDWLGTVLANRIAKDQDNCLFPFTAIVSDCGFAPEVKKLAERFGEENMLLIRLHRPGYDFKNDSRSWISLGSGVREVDIVNDDNLRRTLSLIL